jgi:tRNA threonylcarbamoyladenosine biosynthesis protein TsaE
MSRETILARFAAGWATNSPLETEAAGAALAAILPPDTILALHGDLGAGKTTFVRGFAQAWAVPEPVTSPTFNYFLIYRGSRQLIHLDAYRFSRPEDYDSLLIDEFLESPWCLAIEWPEKLGDRLPGNAWHLFLASPEETHRILTLQMPK